MYEIDLSTLIVIGLDDDTSKIVTVGERIVKESARKIIDESCKYFGSNLIEKINNTKRLVNLSSKSPIMIEDTKNIIFFPLRSTREKNNIWISFNNLDKYEKNGTKTTLKFKCGKELVVDISYYIVDNQVTRSLILDYEVNFRRKSLEK